MSAVVLRSDSGPRAVLIMTRIPDGDSSGLIISSVAVPNIPHFSASSFFFMNLSSWEPFRLND